MPRQWSKAGLQIFPDRQQGEDFPALRNERDIELRPLIGREAIQTFAIPGNGAAADGLVAHDCAKKACLANPIAPEHASNLAWIG